MNAVTLQANFKFREKLLKVKIGNQTIYWQIFFPFVLNFASHVLYYKFATKGKDLIIVSSGLIAETLITVTVNILLRKALLY